MTYFFVDDAYNFVGWCRNPREHFFQALIPSAQTSSVFLVLKALCEVQKQQEYSSF